MPHVAFVPFTGFRVREPEMLELGMTLPGLRHRAGASGPFDLAQSPVPRFDLLGDRPRPRLTIQTQRGCPLACEFCGASRLLGPYRTKPVANVRQELLAAAAAVSDPVLELADDNTFL